MKAAFYNSYGPPEIIQVKEVEKPTPKHNEVLIKVHASTVNRTDCGFRSAEYFIVRFFSGLFRPKSKILGCEFAGQVEAIGESVTLFKTGDRVFGFNDQAFGGHGEYMVIKETDSLETIPHTFSYQEAAPLTEGSHYALCNIRAVKIQRCQQVLVNGGTGAIGSAAIQLLKHFGAQVTAVCDTKNLSLVKSLGADEVIDYTQQDFTQLNKQFDFVFDAVGKSTFGKCKRILKEKGIYISTELGPGAQNPFLAMITPLLGGKKILFPLPTIAKQDVTFLKALAEAGEFKPVVNRVYPLEQIVDAYRYVETGRKIGNVVIQVS